MARDKQQVVLDIDDVRGLAEPILAERLGPYGYRGGLEVFEEPDFDDQPIIQMRAGVGEMVPPRVSIDTGYAINVALRALGDERLVFFYTNPPAEMVKAYWSQRRAAAE